MAASLIDRLPADKRSRALQLLSRNANAPGAGAKQRTRAKGRFSNAAAARGIILIESNVTGALAADIGCTNPQGVGTVTLASTGMTPATTDITISEMDPVTWAAGGAKTITVTVPATDYKGEAVVML